MMTRRNTLAAATLCCLLAAGCATPAQAPPKPDTRDALVAEVAHSVKVLAFTTDRPVREARLLVDGKQVDSQTLLDSDQNGLKVGVVTKGEHVDVFLEVAHSGYAMNANYRQFYMDFVSRSEYFGPGTNLLVKGWTQVYGLSELSGTNALYELRVEVR
jgi:hypothetical protein